MAKRKQIARRRKIGMILSSVEDSLTAQELADKEGIKATAWVRNLIYSELERAYPKSVYDMAKAEDIVVWQKSVRKRIEGRKANKA